MHFVEDDPQNERENGYLDDGFFGMQTFSLDVVHDNRFDDCTIKDVIDMSKHQGDIDWTAVEKSGIDYAIIRAGFRGCGDAGSLTLF